jgi:transcriptional regulator with XRE-family HTH domain
MKNQGYTHGQTTPWVWTMPKPVSSDSPFGERMAALRKAAGYTQAQLADELGVTQRVIAYYEGETDYPPSALLPDLAATLGVTTDELLGVKTVRNVPKTDKRLLQRLKKIEQLPKRDKDALLRTIDAYLAKAE